MPAIDVMRENFPRFEILEHFYEIENDGQAHWFVYETMVYTHRKPNLYQYLFNQAPPVKNLKVKIGRYNKKWKAERSVRRQRRRLESYGEPSKVVCPPYTCLASRGDKKPKWVKDN